MRHYIKKTISLFLVIVLLISSITVISAVDNTASSEQGIIASGIYILRNVGSGKYMDSSGITYLEQSLDKTPTQTEQKYLFKITYLGIYNNEYCYSIRTANSNSVVGSPYPEYQINAEFHDASTIDSYETLGEANVWYISLAGNYYKIKNKYTGEKVYEIYGYDSYIDNTFLCSYDDLTDDNLYIDIVDSSYDSYALWDIIPYTTDSGNNESDLISFDNNEEYYLLSRYRDYANMYSDDKYLYMYGSVTVSANLFIDANNTKWKIERYLETDYYIIRNVDSATSKHCLTAYGTTENSACRISQYTNTPSDNQLWRFTLLHDGSYAIQPKTALNTNYYLAASSDLTMTYSLILSQYNSNMTYTYNWNPFAVGNDVMLLEIEDFSHDHLTGLSETLPYLNSLGYYSFNFLEIYVSSLSKAQSQHTSIKSQIATDMENSRIFISRSHGDFDENGTFLRLWLESSYDSNSDDIKIAALHATDIFDYETQTAKIDLSGCDIALFIGCYTGYDEVYPLNIAAVDAGADYSIGFSNTIICGAANDWTREFFKLYDSLYQQGESIDYLDIALEAKETVDKYSAYENIETNLDSCSIAYKNLP